MCSLARFFPLVGASLDVPEGATAGELEDAYIAKRNQFTAKTVTLTEEESSLLRNVLTTRLETYRELAHTSSPLNDWEQWAKKVDLTLSILNKLAK